ncbi:uncharacterized protein LOC130612281 [Hydractinia symbiolongicarpus]|uniref:uncharacterized protein LOC130612281 n=1 Tax=Hydractinia symbiolongicarpus TaxID=13093 RepID=UPI00254F2862|nr:uncharacterized protein LOC130612281 [Hydractinia symbiolongicarpus]
MSWDHFETWDLQTDLKAAKTKSQKTSTTSKKGSGDGIAAQLGLKKIKRSYFPEVEQLKKSRSRENISSEVFYSKECPPRSKFKTTDRVAAWVNSIPDKKVKPDKPSSENSAYSPKSDDCVSNKMPNSKKEFPRKGVKRKTSVSKINSRLNGAPLMTTPESGHYKNVKKVKKHIPMKQSSSSDCDSQPDENFHSLQKPEDIFPTSMAKKSPKKKVRPATFALEITKVSAGTQTDNPSNVNTQVSQKVKFKIDLKHDQYATRTDVVLYDRNKQSLHGYFESILDKYEPKRYSCGEENCFISLCSRFKVMSTNNMNHVELLPEDNDTPQYGEPIRIFTSICQQHYRKYLDEKACASIPDIIITRLF